MHRSFLLILAILITVGLLAPSAYAQTQPAPPSSATGLFVGPRIGAQLAFGRDIANLFSAGASIGLEAGFRFYKGLFVGARVDHAFVTADAPDLASPPTASGEMTNVDGVVGVLTAVDRAGALLELGGGYRHTAITDTFASAPPTSYSFNGSEVVFGAGAWIPIGAYVRVVPRVDVTIGSLTDPRGNSDSFWVLSTGVSGYFNLDFH